MPDDIHGFATYIEATVNELSPRTGNSAGISTTNLMDLGQTKSSALSFRPKAKFPILLLRRFFSIPSTCRPACSLTTFIVCPRPYTLYTLVVVVTMGTTRRPRRPSSRRPAAIPSLVITLVHASLILQLTSSTSSRRFSCEAAATAPPHPVSGSTVVLQQPSQDALIRTTSSSNSIRRIAFVSAPRNSLPDKYLPGSVLLGLRGGDDVSDDSDDDEEESDQDVSDDEEEVDEEEEEVEEAAPPATKEDLDASLSASAVQSAIKTKVKREIAKKQAAKRAMSEELKNAPAVESSKSKKLKAKKASSSMSFFRVPYVIRAFLNPVTVFRMTLAYWASLFDLDYMKRREAPSQDLRSALQEKARYEPSKKKGSGGSKKQMKRGQAKTLSDLPQLSS
jgi:hypothetical protein